MTLLLTFPDGARAECNAAGVWSCTTPELAAMVEVMRAEIGSHEYLSHPQLAVAERLACETGAVLAVTGRMPRDASPVVVH